jgi:predicted acyltransferase
MYPPNTHCPRLTFQTIFPTFLLCAGFSASLSRPSLPHLAHRTILLTALGLVYNSISALLASRPIRFPGVLQRIALSSFINATQPFGWAFPVIAAAAWVGGSVWGFDPECHPGRKQAEGNERWFWPARCSAQTRLDYVVFGSEHMYAPDYDPEGLLSTLTTAAITVWAGTSLPSPTSFAPPLLD